ncbi:LytR/AlgR family response regulator transcription factor [Cellulomonas hominis]|uniref:LytR/AlgR family response regulator transcription factor n=1 Tax=Cellulomonas hominis TaxID=156981 RepID=UPI001BA1B217|nr:LytTR family DNA-binding domain-containing protein [Cellulomonas hominis]VTR76010.1 Transcriptional regulatory protein YehT [Cellulomonas hominis]
MSELRVAVVEDDPDDRQRLVELLDRFQAENGVRFEIHHFSDGRDIVRRYRAAYDVILLDVQMQHLDGLETARRIRNLDPRVVIVFVTHLVSSAPRGYEVDAMDFLVKPVSYFSLARSLTRSAGRLRRHSGAAVLLPTSSGTARVPVADIVYAASSSRHRIDVHTVDGSYGFSGTLRALEDDLVPQAGFFRSNSCFLVNLRHVAEVRQASCVMTTGAELVISRSRRRAFLEALTDDVAHSG